jgi:hypothetical protein
VKEGKKERREGVDKKTTVISLMRALSFECLVCDGCIIHGTPRTAVAKTPLTQRKEENKKSESEREQDTRC